MLGPTFTDYDIFVDESSQTGHRFIVIGALFCRADVTPKIEAYLEKTIAAHGGTSEMKWGKVTRRNLPLYEKVITDIFGAFRRNSLYFHCIVIDNNLVDHKRFNDGDPEIGFNKYLFTLLYKFARKYRSNSRFYGYLDDRTTQHTPEHLREMLNARARRDLRLGYDPFRRITFAQSHLNRMIQVTDVLTGCIAYDTNKHYLAGSAAPHRVRMLNHVRELAGVVSLAIPTKRPNQPFDIWHIKWE